MVPSTVRSYSYEAADRQTPWTDKLGRRIDTAYDNAKRKTGETWYATDVITVVNQSTWTYDSASRVTTVGDNNGTYTFTYDADGRVSHVDEPNGFSMTFAYDAQGHRTGVVDSLGGIQTSVYDDSGRLKTRAQGTALVSKSYYADGQVSRIDRYGSGVLVSRSSCV